MSSLTTCFEFKCSLEYLETIGVSYKMVYGSLVLSNKSGIFVSSANSPEQLNSIVVGMKAASRIRGAEAPNMHD